MMFKVVMFVTLFALAFAENDPQTNAADQVGAQSMVVKDVLPYPYRSVESSNYVPIKYTDASAFVLTPVEEAKTALSIKDHFVGAAWSVVKFVAHNIIALVLGAAVAIGICKLTPICYILSEKFHSADKFKAEMRSFMTPERISSATQFLHKAIDKYANSQ